MNNLLLEHAQTFDYNFTMVSNAMVLIQYVQYSVKTFSTSYAL